MKKLINKGFMLFLNIVLVLTLTVFTDVDAYASADNSLQYIKVENAQLTPDFKYNVINYTTNVDNSVTKLKISAKPNNRGAKIVSITGADNLKVGKNYVVITVQAANGNSVKYRITVNRAEGSGDDAAYEEEESSTGTEENSADKSKTATKKSKKKKKKDSAELKKAKAQVNELQEKYDNLETQYKSLLTNFNKVKNQKNILQIFVLIFALFLIITIIMSWYILNSLKKKYRRLRAVNADMAKKLKEKEEKPMDTRGHPTLNTNMLDTPELFKAGAEGNEIKVKDMLSGEEKSIKIPDVPVEINNENDGETGDNSDDDNDDGFKMEITDL